METNQFKDSKPIDRLVVFLAFRKISQWDFVRAMDVPRYYVAKSRKERNGHISGRMLERIHEAYPELNLVWLIFGEGNMLQQTVLPEAQ